MSKRTGGVDPAAPFQEETHGVLRSYDNKIEERLCLWCGKIRPYDWFNERSNACWSCRCLHPELEGNLAAKGSEQDGSDTK